LVQRRKAEKTMIIDAASIVKKYVELRDFVQERTKEFEKGGPTVNDREFIRLLRDPAATAELFMTDRCAIADRLEQLTTPMAAYKAAMEVLEGAAHALMKETKQDALSTEYGTAFKVPKSSVTCTDKEAFHAWVRKTNAWGFLTGHVSKEAVEEWMELNEGKIPPGIKVDGWVAVQFRRA
jgi:hypothetical protein